MNIDSKNTGHEIYTRKEGWHISRDITLDENRQHQIDFQPDFPLQVNGYRFDSNYSLTPNRHDYFEITVVSGGGGRFIVQNKSFPGHKGDIFISGGYQFHTLEENKKSPIFVLSAFFLPELVFKAGTNSLDFEYVRPFFDHQLEHHPIIPASHPSAPEIIKRIKKLQRNSPYISVLSKLDAKNDLLRILRLVTGYYADFSCAQKLNSVHRQRDIQRLHPVFTLLQEHYSDPFIFEKATKTAFMSKAYFCKFFKKVTGGTFTQYLSRLRIDKAKQLLLRGDIPVGQIAYDVGFESHSYFDRTFQRLTGYSPSRFFSNTHLKIKKQNK